MKPCMRMRVAMIRMMKRKATRLTLVVAFDHPADGEARIVSGKREGRVEMVAADIVEIDVDSVGRRCREALEDRPGLVVDHGIGAERADIVAFLRAAGRTDHGHALRPGDLDHCRADRAGRCRDEDDIAGLCRAASSSPK